PWLSQKRCIFVKQQICVMFANQR
ncbi:hypothetical protein D046_1800, partial [Vibrio parahaemolyticus V-223/04]